MSSRKSKGQPRPTLVSTPKKVVSKPKTSAKKAKGTTPSINSFFPSTKADSPNPTVNVVKRKSFDVKPKPPSASAVESEGSETPTFIEDCDLASQEQELHVAKRQKWIREFMAGKEVHPFFLQVRSQPAPASPQPKPVLRILKPMAASLPGQIFYASSIDQSQSEQCKHIRHSYSLPELQSSSLNLMSPGVSDPVSLDKEEFYFPISPLAWIELFKQFGLSEELDNHCYWDFFFDPESVVSATSGNWLKTYSAASSKQFLGNQKCIAEIRAWLENWKVIACSQDVSDDEYTVEIPHSDEDSDYGKKGKKPIKSKRLGSKDSSRRKKTKPRLPPITILSGPSGVGKTAAAYACAQDCGYRVLEINATSARTGSDLINLVEQLSRNHLVNSSNGFFKAKETPSAPKPNLLILIDEADLLFHGEKSFLTSLVHLAASTRRPFILTINDSLPSFNMPKGLLYANFKMQQAPTDNLATFLQLMCLNEHLILPQSLAYTLIKYYNGDFRKIVLELEILSRIQSVSSTIKSAIDASACFFPSMPVDTSFLAFFPEQKVITLIPIPHNLLGQESMDPIHPDNLQSYLGDHFASVHNPDYGWASKSFCQNFPYSHSDSLWPKLPIDESLSLDIYSQTIDTLSYCDTLEPSVLELDFMQAPEVCLLPLPILDEDEINQQSKPIKAHTCPNKPTLLLSPSFIYPEYCSVPAIRMKWKNTYFSEAIKEVVSLNSNLLELALGGHLGMQHRMLLHEALKSASPTNRSFSFNENVCISLPYFSLLIKREGLRTSRLRSKKILTSKFFPNSSSSQLGMLTKYGVFSNPSITVAVTSSEQTNSLGSDSEGSSEDFFPRQTFAKQ